MGVFSAEGFRSEAEMDIVIVRLLSVVVNLMALVVRLMSTASVVSVKSFRGS